MDRRAEVQQALIDFDKDGSGTLDFLEFMKVLACAADPTSRNCLQNQKLAANISAASYQKSAISNLLQILQQPAIRNRWSETCCRYFSSQKLAVDISAVRNLL